MFLDILHFLIIVINKLRNIYIMHVQDPRMAHALYTYTVLLYSNLSSTSE